MAKDFCLVKNNIGGVPGNHLEALRNVIRNATEIYTAVAFLKQEGLKEIFDMFQTRLDDGAKIEMFIGRDFCLTEPEALKMLFKLSEKHDSLIVYLVKRSNGATFHPKIYLGHRKQRAQVLLGSANLTGGALKYNDEISLSFRIKLSDSILKQIHNVFAFYRLEDKSEKLSESVLEKYRFEYESVQEDHRRAKKINDAFNTDLFKPKKISNLYKDYCQDSKTESTLKWRREHRESAKEVQLSISKLSRNRIFSERDIELFKNLYNDLVTSTGEYRHLWCSDGIHRQKSNIFQSCENVINLFAVAEMAAKLSIKEASSIVFKLGSRISGIGSNTISEILCTFAPHRFAVSNGKSLKALQKIGANPPSKTDLDPKRAAASNDYESFCEIVRAVGACVRLSDLSDVDAFLYWICEN